MNRVEWWRSSVFLRPEFCVYIGHYRQHRNNKDHKTLYQTYPIFMNQEVPSDSLLLDPYFPLFPGNSCYQNAETIITISPGIKPSDNLLAFLPVFLMAFPPPFRSLHSYIGNAFHKHTPGAISICPTPLRITALPRKLPKEQRRYRESLASSISNSFPKLNTGASYVLAK